MPNSLVFDRYCAEILEQTRALRQVLKEADPATRVPTCPEWTLRDLAVHVGGAHRWAGAVVGNRAERPVPYDEVPGRGGPAPLEDPAADAGALDEWLAEGARRLSDTLREAGAETPVWTWTDERRAGFWARRMTHETVVHRADACLARDLPYEVDPEVAADCLDEWLEIVASKALWQRNASLKELSRRAGSALHLHSTDTGQTVAAEWLITLEDDGIDWRRAHQKADVALRGPLTDVLLVFYRRLPASSDRVEVLGDAELLDFWLDRASFG